MGFKLGNVDNKASLIFNNEYYLLSEISNGKLTDNMDDILHSIDVIEGNTELVNYVDWINSNINVINHNPWNYTPNKTYDIIICDLWAEPDDITQDNKTNLVNNYSSHLKTGGKIIIPISGETIS